MVNLKRYQIDDIHVIGIEIDLPANPVYIISNTHGFLCGSIFSRYYLENSRACVCIMKEDRSFNHLLESCVMSLNKRAKSLGIKVGMSGREAIKKMHQMES